MPHYVPLSRSSHGNAGLLHSGYTFSLNKMVVPLVAEELPQVLPTMPIAFVPISNNQGFKLVALQSLQSGVNLYVHTNGRWIGGYRPAWYREYPFRLVPDSSGKQRVLCIDEESPAFEPNASDRAVRLLDDQGEPTQRTKETVSFLQKLDKARSVTAVLVTELANAGVIAPWHIKTQQAEGGEEQKVQGLFHIDESALRALEPEAAARLLKTGALSLAYAQLLSEHRLQSFGRLSELRARAERNKGDSDVDLEDLFGEDDDDLSFSF